MRCPKCHHENPDDTYFCGKCATQIRPLEGAIFTKTMTVGTAYKVPDKGAIFAGKYKIMGELGRGGMGVVYLAEDTKLKRTVALKFLPPEPNLNPEAKERFLREAQAAAVLDHPNICTVHEVEEAEGITYIALAYVEGQSLREKIAKRPLDIDQAVGIALQVAEGLEAAHHRGIVHRDIKSGNIMVKDDGQAKIMDFGLAKVAGESALTRDAKTMGTVAYMSPEQARGEATDHRTDIWSLGVVLYEMLTGELPFRGERETSIMYSIVHEEPKPLQKLKSDIPTEVSKIVDRAMRKDRNARFATAGEMGQDLRKYQESIRVAAAGVFNIMFLLRRLRKPLVAIPSVLVLVAIAALSFRFFNRQAKIRWAKNTIVPEIRKLVDSGATHYSEAYSLAKTVERFISHNSEFRELLSQCSVITSIKTSPDGARVAIKEYGKDDQNWTLLGVTPIENLRVPKTLFTWKFNKQGYEEVIAASFTWTYDSTKKEDVPLSFDISLDKDGALPSGMVRIKERDIPRLGLINDYFIDRFEVTNRQYKEFVDQGGYQKRAHWKQKFIRNGRELTWDDAMAMFRDSTGRPGPAAWKGGDFPEGHEDYPVSGISWYEAAAYADFKGENLPTIVHWGIASGPAMASSQHFAYRVIPLFNFSGQGPLPVGKNPGLTSYGVFDMGGNVREWCWNETAKGRVVRGGAWDDYTYMYGNISQSDPFDRSDRTGFRCVRYLDIQKIPNTAFQPYNDITRYRDYTKEKPSSDSEFKIYKNYFQYDKADFSTTTFIRDESSKDWTKEKISVPTAYGNDRLVIYLYLPKRFKPPLQAIIFFPGANAHTETSSENLEGTPGFRISLAPFIKNGRTLVYPVYLGTYERNTKLVPWNATETHEYTDYQVKLVKDVKRTIDYLESRQDIDKEKIAFIGLSWGGFLGFMIPAVDDRLAANILYCGGLPAIYGKSLPEVDYINYVTRVRIPTLLLNGKYDMQLPLDTCVNPGFQLLGTSPKDKKLILYDTDHFIPTDQFIKETLNWLDKYLGPVK